MSGATQVRLGQPADRHNATAPGQQNETSPERLGRSLD